MASNYRTRASMDATEKSTMLYKSVHFVCSVYEKRLDLGL